MKRPLGIPLKPFTVVCGGSRVTVTHKDAKEAWLAARKMAGAIAEKNIDTPVRVYAKGGTEPVWVSHVRYAPDSPVWSAPPDQEQASALLSSVILCALFDAGVRIGGAAGFSESKRINQKYAETFRSNARAYILFNQYFKTLCDLAGINVESARAKVRGLGGAA